jgi:hypothetical protein
MSVSVSARAILFRWDWQQVANKGSACCHPFADSQGEETEIVHRPLRGPARIQGDWLYNVGAQSGQILTGHADQPIVCGFEAWLREVPTSYWKGLEMVKQRNENASAPVGQTRRPSSFSAVGNGLIVGVGMVATFCRRAIGLLAESATTAPADDPLSNEIRAGVMNHRTGKFDERNDPAGWYERD